MTVSELIEQLSKLPPDANVYGVDYEDGAYPVTWIELDYPALKGQVVLQ